MVDKLKIEGRWENKNKLAYIMAFQRFGDRR
jgi:hypothetical protein